MKSDLNESSKIFIGEIHFSKVITEEKIGNTTLENLGNCKVYVYGKEGPIPHCHIIPDSPKKNFKECCIRLNMAGYFSHGSKDSKLTNAQAKQFNDWCKEQNYKYGTDLTNWQVMCNAWIFANRPYDFPKNQPNYEELNM